MKSPCDGEKSKRYDRQLRLWGDHGQASLESAHVCLINATATGTEALKSLVLPGIGAFTIVDGNKVSGEDVGNNFFLEKDSIGESRAKVATDLLLELNSDVHGDFVDESPENILEGNPSFFKTFTVVIATGLIEKTLLQLSEKLWEDGVPLLVCRAYGMIGYMRLQVREHTVVESHPDSVFHDLRLDRPFSALQEFVDSVNMETLTNQEHSHTPFVVILLKYLEKWKKENDGKLPKMGKEKNMFKAIIKEGIRNKAKPEEEENFEEAVKAVNRCITETKVPSDTKALLDDPECLNLSLESKPFWIMVRALKEFVENEGNGCLPVTGVIPDMTADTDRYVKLQNIYKKEAKKDAQVVYKKVQDLLSSLGKPQDLISESEVKLFCKNSYSLRLVRGRSLEEEYHPKKAKVQDILANLEHSDNDMVFYVLLRAVDRFYSEYNEYPGYCNDELGTDIKNLRTCLCRIVQEWGSSPLMSRDDYILEMCRFGAAELHSVAAFIGGCAAQEVIKLITEQYVPFNNTFIYNAMTETTTVFFL